MVRVLQGILVVAEWEALVGEDNLDLPHHQWEVDEEGRPPVH